MQEVRGSSPRISTRDKLYIMEPHISEQLVTGMERVDTPVEEVQSRQALRALMRCTAALLAGATMLGPAVANADKQAQLPATVAASGGTTYVSPSGTEHYDCVSNFNFRVGIQDDNQFVWQQNISRNEAFSLATKIFGASVLRINVIYGVAEKYGLSQYVDTVKSATKHGYQVQVTIMPTPAYEPTLSQKLSYKNHNPKVMEKFAHQVASRLGRDVVRYSIWNEPDDQRFFVGTMQSYDDSVEAGDAGILSANPHAQIAVGELAVGKNFSKWLKNDESLPGQDLEVHPYGGALLKMLSVAEEDHQAGKATLLDEYGNRVGPDQLDRDRKAIRIAVCSDAAEIIFYQLVRNYHDSWDTGVYNPPERSRTRALAIRFQSSRPHQEILKVQALSPERERIPSTSR
jgi:hypothetical protein